MWSSARKAVATSIWISWSRSTVGHDQMDAPAERGRRVVTAQGGGQFHFDVIRRRESGNAPVEVRHRGPGELG
jgi:hypothetical protein